MTIIKQTIGNYKYHHTIYILDKYSTLLIIKNRELIYEGLASNIIDDSESISFRTKDGTEINIDKGIRYSTATSTLFY